MNQVVVANSTTPPTRITSTSPTGDINNLSISPRTTPTSQLQQQDTTSSNSNNIDENNHHHAAAIAASSSRQKPILMCFICKLSFGMAKLFSSHASSEHKLNLSESEKVLLCREYSSAIIQKNADDISQISFLEPLDASRAMSMTGSSSDNAIDADNQSDNNNNSNNENDATEMMTNDDGAGSDSMKDYSLEHPRLTPKSLASLQNPITSAASVIQRLAGDFKFLNSQADLSQLTSLLEQHKTLNEFLSQQQQQMQSQQRVTCPEHADVPNLSEVDCKNCEFLNINAMSPMRSSSKSPLKGYAHESNASSKTSSPITSSVTPTTQQQLQQLQQQLQASQQQQNINTSPSFTIGACPDHMNGRPIGVDCAR